MKLRDPRQFEKPEIIIIPMIDIMFFLLVFFMISTMSMVDLKTVDVNMPKAKNVETNLSVTYLVTLKKDGSLWLEDKPITQDDLLRRAQVEQSKNSRFAVAIRADETVDYGTLMQLMDALKGAGISRFALAADKK
ncbi:ExbD/TolR family protein [Acidaminococcus massiliensis]|jgi:biopolymer transport protein ExbD|uniref:ExbD/TolR family protein n=1 Tax=Acidaminococcus massiliensis TaxID=1852375 RepID=UPI00094E8DB2|nr:biopolymer transporter ExbD [Acidaminococcus massiliensis]